MKAIFKLALGVLLLAPVLASCKGEEVKTTTPTDTVESEGTKGTEGTESTNSNESYLKGIFNISSYQYEIKENEFNDIYYRVDNKFKRTLLNDKEAYLVINPDGSEKYIEKDGGDVHYIESKDIAYKDYKKDFIAISLDKVDIANLELTDKNISIKNKDKFSKELINMEGFKNITISLNEGKLDSIVLDKYTISISNINNTSFTVPEGGKSFTSEYDTIESIYTMPDGTFVNVCGKVMGSYGNNFFIEDSTKGILVYLGSNSEYANEIKDGSVISFKASVSTFKNVKQLTGLSNLAIKENKLEIEIPTLASGSQNELKTHINSTVNFMGAEIETLPTYKKSKDYTFTLSKGSETINVFFSHNHSDAEKSKFQDLLKTLKIGDTINLINAHVSRYNVYQLVISTSTKINKGSSIYLNSEKTVFDAKLSAEEIINSIDLIEIDENGKMRVVDKSEYVVRNDYLENKIGRYTFTYTYKGHDYSIVIETKNSKSFKSEVNDTLFKDKNIPLSNNKDEGVRIGMPSIGSPKGLVIPIALKDYPAPKDMKANLEIAFNGTSEETGWESLSSYYYKSSYGKLNLTCDILDPFTVSYTKGEVDSLYDQFLIDEERYFNGQSNIYPEGVDYLLIKEALDYYDGSVDFSKYDYNNDGFIDSIYFIYTVPYDRTGDSIWWAYTTEYLPNVDKKYDNKYCDFYIFQSYSFFLDDLNGVPVTMNSETVIHESGHLMGLNDYYDYDPSDGDTGGLGGGDMMDANIGDHNAYSKLLLGWVEPWIIEDASVDLTLRPFESSGDCIFIFDSFNGSFYTEFYMLEFYTPTGLNKQASINSILFSISGLKVFHVDNTLGDLRGFNMLYDINKYNNSNTSHNQIKLIEADNGRDIDRGYPISNDDLFTTGMSYKDSSWYNGSKTGFTITVNSINASELKLSIKY